MIRLVLFFLAAAIAFICAASSTASSKAEGVILLPAAYLDATRPRQVPHAHVSLPSPRDCAFWSVKPDLVVKVEVFFEPDCAPPLASSALIASLVSPWGGKDRGNNATVFATTTDGSVTEFLVRVRSVRELRLKVSSSSWRRLSSTNFDGFPAVRLFVGSAAVVEAEAFDEEGNKLVSDGLSFRWSLQPISEPVVKALAVGEGGVLLGGGNPLTADADAAGKVVGAFTTRSLHIIEEDKDGGFSQHHHHHDPDADVLSGFIEGSGENASPKPATAAAASSVVTKAPLTSPSLRINIKDSGRHLLCAQLFVPPSGIPKDSGGVGSPLPFSCLELRLRQQLALRPFASPQSTLFLAPAAHLLLRLFKISPEFDAEAETMIDREEEVKLPSSRFLFLSSNSRVISCGVHHGIVDSTGDGGDAKLITVDMSVRDATTSSRVHSATRCGDVAGSGEEEACSSEELGGVIAPVSVVQPAFSALWVEPVTPIPSWLSFADAARELKKGEEVSRQAPPWCPAFECDVKQNDEWPDYCYSPYLGPDYPSPLPGTIGVLGKSRVATASSSSSSSASFLGQTPMRSEVSLTSPSSAAERNWLGVGSALSRPLNDVTNQSLANGGIFIVTCDDFDLSSCRPVPTQGDRPAVVRVVAGVPFRLRLSLAGEGAQRIVMGTNVRWRLRASGIINSAGGNAASVLLDPFPHRALKAPSARVPTLEHGHGHSHGGQEQSLEEEEVQAPSPWIQEVKGSTEKASSLVWPEVTGAIIHAFLPQSLIPQAPLLGLVEGHLQLQVPAPPPPCIPVPAVDLRFELPKIEHPINHVTWRNPRPKQELTVGARVEVVPPLTLFWPQTETGPSGALFSSIPSITFGSDGRGVTNFSLPLVFSDPANRLHFVLDSFGLVGASRPAPIQVDSTGLVTGSGEQAEAMIVAFDPSLPFRGFTLFVSVSRPASLFFPLPSAAGEEEGRGNAPHHRLELYRGDVAVIPVFATGRDGREFTSCVDIGKMFTLSGPQSPSGDVEVLFFSGQGQGREQRPFNSTERVAILIEQASLPTHACGALVLRAVRPSSSDSGGNQQDRTSFQVHFEDVSTAPLAVTVLERPSVLYPLPVPVPSTAAERHEEDSHRADAFACPLGQHFTASGGQQLGSWPVVFSCRRVPVGMERHPIEGKVVGVGIGASTALIVAGGNGKAESDSERSGQATAVSLFSVCVERCPATSFFNPLYPGRTSEAPVKSGNGCREQLCFPASGLASTSGNEAAALAESLAESFGLSLSLEQSFVAEVQPLQQQKPSGEATALSYSNPSQSMTALPLQAESLPFLAPGALFKLPGSAYHVECLASWRGNRLKPTPFSDVLLLSFAPPSSAAAGIASSQGNASFYLVCDLASAAPVLALQQTDDALRFKRAEGVDAPLSRWRLDKPPPMTGGEALRHAAGVRKQSDFVLGALLMGHNHRSVSLVNSTGAGSAAWQWESCSGRVISSLQKWLPPPASSPLEETAWLLEDFLPLSDLSLVAVAPLLPPSLLHEGNHSALGGGALFVDGAPFIDEGLQQQRYLRRESKKGWILSRGTASAEAGEDALLFSLDSSKRKTGTLLALQVTEPLSALSLDGAEEWKGHKILLHNAAAETHASRLILGGCGKTTPKATLEALGDGRADSVAVAFTPLASTNQPSFVMSVRPQGPSALSSATAGGKAVAKEGLFRLFVKEPCFILPAVAASHYLHSTSILSMEVEVARPAAVILSATAPYLPLGASAGLDMTVLTPRGSHFPRSQFRFMHPRVIVNSSTSEHQPSVRVEERWAPCDQIDATSNAEGGLERLANAALDSSQRCLVPRFLVHGLSVGAGVVKVEVESCWLQEGSEASNQTEAAGVRCQMLSSNPLALFVHPPLSVEPKEVTLLPDSHVRLNVAADKQFAGQWQRYLEVTSAESKKGKLHRRRQFSSFQGVADEEEEQQEEKDEDAGTTGNRSSRRERLPARSKGADAAAAFQSILHLVRFTSSNESVATVAEDGLVSARGLGTAQIAVTLKSAKDAAEFLKRRKKERGTEEDTTCVTITHPGALLGSTTTTRHECVVRNTQSDTEQEEMLRHLMAGQTTLVRVALPSAVFISTDPADAAGSAGGDDLRAVKPGTAGAASLPLIALIAERRLHVVTNEKHSPLSLSSSTSITVSWRLLNAEEESNSGGDASGDYFLPFESELLRVPAANDTLLPFGLVTAEGVKATATTKGFAGLFVVANHRSFFPGHTRVFATVEVETRLFGRLTFHASAMLAVIPELMLLHPFPVSVHPLASQRLTGNSSTGIDGASSSSSSSSSTFEPHMLLLPPSARAPVVTSLDSATSWLPPGLRTSVKATVATVRKPRGKAGLLVPLSVSALNEDPLSAALVSRDTEGASILQTRDTASIASGLTDRTLTFLALEHVVDVDPSALTAFRPEDVEQLRRLARFLPAQSLTIRIVVEPPSQLLLLRDSDSTRREEGAALDLSAGNKAVLAAVPADSWSRRMSVGFGSLCPLPSFLPSIPCTAESLGLHLFSSDHFVAMPLWFFAWERERPQETTGLINSKWRQDELFIVIEAVAEGKSVVEALQEPSSSSVLLRGDSVEVAVRTVISPSGNATLAVGGVVLFTLSGGSSSLASTGGMDVLDPLVASQQMVKQACSAIVANLGSQKDISEASSRNYWASSDSSVLFVDPSTGCAFALAAGKARVSLSRGRPAQGSEEGADVTVVSGDDLRFDLHPVVVDAEEAPLVALPKTSGGSIDVRPPEMAAQRRALPLLRAASSSSSSSDSHHLVFHLASKAADAPSIIQGVRFSCDVEVEDGTSASQSDLVAFALGPGAFLSSDEGEEEATPSGRCIPPSSDRLYCHKQRLWPDSSATSTSSEHGTDQPACTKERSLPEISVVQGSLSAAAAVQRALRGIDGVGERKAKELTAALEDLVTRIAPFDRFCVVVSKTALQQYRPGGTSLPFSTVFSNATIAARPRLTVRATAVQEGKTSVGSLRAVTLDAASLLMRFEGLPPSPPIIVPLPLAVCQLSSSPLACFPPATSQFWRVFNESEVMQAAQRANLLPANVSVAANTGDLLSPLLIKKPDQVCLTGLNRKAAFAVCTADADADASFGLKVEAEVMPEAEGRAVQLPMPLTVDVLETSSLFSPGVDDDDDAVVLAAEEHDEHDEEVAALLLKQRGRVRCPKIVTVTVSDASSSSFAGVQVRISAFVEQNAASMPSRPLSTATAAASVVISFAFDNGEGLPLLITDTGTGPSAATASSAPTAAASGTASQVADIPMQSEGSGEDEITTSRLLFVGGPLFWLGTGLAGISGLTATFVHFANKRVAAVKRRRELARKRAGTKPRMRRTASALPAGFAFDSHPLTGTQGAAPALSSASSDGVTASMTPLRRTMTSPQPLTGAAGAARRTTTTTTTTASNITSFRPYASGAGRPVMAAPPSLSLRPRASPSPLSTEVKASTKTSPSLQPSPSKSPSPSPSGPNTPQGAASFAAMASRHS